MYSELVIGYLFLGGTAAGGMFAMSAWDLARKSARSHTVRSSVVVRRNAAFCSLQTLVYPLCLALLLAGILFLLWDLGRPERVLLVLFQPHATPLTFGTLCLIGSVIVGALLVLSTAFRAPTLQGRTQSALEAIACVFALGTMAYTGVFLMSGISVALWSSWAVVALFTCSSLSCGLSVMLLTDWFVRDRTLLLRAARPLQRMHLLCLACEALSLASFVLAAISNPAAAPALSALSSPEMLSTALVGVVGFGILAPFALEVCSLAQADCRTIPVSDALCLCGGLCLRYCVIVCGVQ